MSVIDSDCALLCSVYCADAARIIKIEEIYVLRCDAERLLRVHLHHF